MRVKEIFNSDFAVYYEKFINRLSSPVQVNRWRRALIRGALSVVPEPEVIVDFCSGAGNMGELLLEEKPGVKILNCDISKPLLHLARERLENSGYYICSDNRFFPLRNSVVDVLFSSFCVRNSPEPPLTVSESLRVLRKGGVWAVLDFFKPNKGDMLFKLNNYLFKSFMNLSRLITKSKEAIDYLFESIENFFTMSEFVALLNKSGFRVLAAQEFMGGVAGGVIAIKEVENV